MMGREQDLIQAVKNGDVPGVQKLVAKVKASKSSEYICFLMQQQGAKGTWALLPAASLVSCCEICL